MQTEKEIFELTDRIIASRGGVVRNIIPILQDIQNTFSYLPHYALERVCDTTEITASDIFSVSTFFSQFSHEKAGKHTIRVCVGTACHVKGAGLVYDAFKRELKLENNRVTTDDGQYSLLKVACLGCCTIAPVVQIDDITYGNVRTDNVSDILDDFVFKTENSVNSDMGINKEREDVDGEIRIGLGSCCVASGSSDVKIALDRVLSDNRIKANVKHVGCVGICNQVPMIEVHRKGMDTAVFTKITPPEVRNIVLQYFKPASKFVSLKNSFINFIETLSVENVPASATRYTSGMRDTPVSDFLDKQINIATESRGEMKPLDLGEYLSNGGFNALRKCIFDFTPEYIIDEVTTSGLRGRGGAGFPTGKKWEMVRNSSSDTKFIICNGDEGDPGAFMDRMLLESYPFRIIEGMLIAGIATGATHGIFYIRAEYKLAVKQMLSALEICKNSKLTGNNILESDFNFEIELFSGAGAFICGEETALIASMEGQRGFSRLRPPYPAQKGFLGKPTLINNAETFSLVSWIIRNGSAAFNSIGTESSKGTKVFALAGKIKRGGLIEVPMGTTIQQIVEDIGGGTPGGHFKAVQIGGPSGGCIPSELAGIPVDYESLNKAGAMMGSGGLVVLDDKDCMVDIARYFLSFTQDQSCGKCTWCRVGTRRLLDMLDDICSGRGKEGDIEKLEKLAVTIKKGSLCGLGKTAPNPVLSTIKYYRHEYEAHLKGKCPAGKCAEMITYSISNDCIGCTKCAQKCPSDAIISEPYSIHVIDMDKCVKCDNCRQVCPSGAVLKV